MADRRRRRLFGRDDRAAVFSPFSLLTLALLAGVVVWAPLSVAEARWVDHLDALPPLTLGGLLVGFLLSRSRLPATLAHPIGLLLGLEAIVWQYAGVPRSGTLAERVDWLAARVSNWSGAVMDGGASNDPLLFALAMAVVGWSLGYASAWLVFRGHAPWLALVSNGLALLMNLSYAPAALGQEYLPRFLFAAPLFLAGHQLARRDDLWRRAHLLVESRLPARVLAGSAVAAGMLLSLAWAAPPGGSNPAITRGWDRLITPWRNLERDFDRVFASVNGADAGARGLNFGRTIAPRGAFELADTPVMEVRSPVPRYWRATTADRYTGQALTTSEVASVDVAAGEPIVPPEQVPDARSEVTSTIKILASRSSVAFAPDAPLRLNVASQMELRGTPEDIATIRLETPLLRGQEYEVVSAASSASIQQLRTAGQDYPAWVRERYLQLPSRLPRRVAERSRDIVRSAPTPFDAAVALETYLRGSYQYSTRVGPVPPDRDWVDYFLFEMSEGYCDFFSTSMMVMLRTQGIPARVAAGFAPGEVLDAAAGTWLVRENHAHSWVEAYFPRYGWILFEPSAIRPVPERLDAPVAAPVATPETRADPGLQRQLNPDEMQELQGLSGTRQDAVGRLPAWALALVGTLAAGAALLLLAAGAATVAWRRGLGSLAWYQRPYAQLLRLARWLGVIRPAAAQTPYELAAVLRREVPGADATISHLTDVYVEGTYGGRPPAADPWKGWLSVRRGLAAELAKRRARRTLQRFRRPGDERP